MRLSHIVAIGMLVFWLCSCGRPDIAELSDTTSGAGSPTPGPGIIEILRQPPAPKTSFEVDAYVTTLGATRPSLSPGSNIGPCPLQMQVLSDRPFPGTLPILDSAAPTYLPDDAPWLGVSADQALPYHVRLRGHLGDPTLQDCPRADRIFRVEKVVTVYESSTPTSSDDAWQHVPADYQSWQRYHDATLGYSFPYPPDGRVDIQSEPDALATVVVHAPEWHDYTVTVRISQGETHGDPYHPADAPPRLRGNFRAFTQDQVFSFSLERIETQHLTGYIVERGEPHAPEVTALFNAHGRTYELTVRYPTGLDALLPLMQGYAGLVMGFTLDTPPEPTPGPNPSLGTGPLLNQEQAIKYAQQVLDPNLQDRTTLEARLVSAAEASKQKWECPWMQIPSDGVWLVTIRGTDTVATYTFLLALNAKTGEQLCGQQVGDSILLPTPNPYPAP